MIPGSLNSIGRERISFLLQGRRFVRSFSRFNAEPQTERTLSILVLFGVITPGGHSKAARDQRNTPMFYTNSIPQPGMVTTRLNSRLAIQGKLIYHPVVWGE